MADEKKITPGWRTSEFWLTLAAAIVGALLMSGAIADGGTAAKVVGAAATVLSTLGYQVARGKAKAIEAPKA